MPVLMLMTLGSWVLNDIWIIDLSSALVGMLMSSSNFCSELSSFTLRCKSVNGILINQPTFELLHFCFQIRLWFQI